MCVLKGERMTSSRQRTLELVLQADGPIKAYDVIDRFHTEGAAKPPTVYRALSFLEQMGLIHRIESLNAYVACIDHDHGHEPIKAHRAMFLLCVCCGKSEEIVLPHFDGIDEAAHSKGFEISHLTLEAKGKCQACH